MQFNPLLLTIRELIDMKSTIEDELVARRIYIQNNFLNDAEMILANNKEIIQAIKLYRERTGCTLMFAKEVVDFYRDKMTRAHNQVTDEVN